MCASSLLRVLAVAMATVFIVTSADQKHQLELKQHYEHLHYISLFPCHEPQPRVLAYHKLFSPEHTKGKAFFPDVTVLHRCNDETGCCTSGKVCRHQDFVAVELPFKVTFLEDTPEHKKGSWIMEYHILKNHTSCACQEPLPHGCPNDFEKPSPNAGDNFIPANSQPNEYAGSSYVPVGQYNQEQEPNPYTQESSTNSADSFISDLF